jgi:hypothetical protein
MGLIFVLVLAGITAAMINFFGYAAWVMIVLGVLWLASLVYCVVFGHHGFGGKGNTDAQIIIAGMFITIAILIPKFEAQNPCNQAKQALTKLARAEYKYFSAHKSYTKDLQLLDLELKPEIEISIAKADENSFTAAASHKLCQNTLIWDSDKGGLQ